MSEVLAHPLGEGVVLGEQAVAPALGGVQREGLLGARHLERGDRLAQQLRIDPAHELADVLPLAAAALVRAGALELQQGVEQELGHVQRGQARVGHLDELLAQRLQVVHVLLQPRLARAVGEVVVAGRCGLVVVKVVVRVHGRSG